MNLLLLTAKDFSAPGRVIIDDRRFQHCLKVHQARLGDILKVGLLNDKIGSGRVIFIDQKKMQLEVELSAQPPEKLPLTLIMALPRPKMLKRIFQTCATMGVADLILINAYRVEKSYWQSPFLQPEKINEHLCLGLEQGIDTGLPKVSLKKRFKPFVEDELPNISQNKRLLVAHPYNAVPCPHPDSNGLVSNTTVLAIGPEGGFIPYEIEKLSNAGFKPIHLGPRILRVETALSVLLAKLF
ncbi:16S rRNA (uracil(1498)-N(3))-methyltransferase [Motiliproteus sp. MSK22-1]|uniref:16S rRNA (uracil(1498)-N(3))-methyltransferase n=1 Tax=Motiliproteus sp. MSK22-1 TaxID=1897630 RepID=UPI000978BD2E|nr:16S rRNA (uracil(1498)-N(3))-methyltransferase [Motiliproteus sp. MSK22-1]OMH38147.1 16S rRNA (uracil(1498)-N(3))-methyltransferase [Motiliproteus sp. MSK22-1]